MPGAPPAMHLVADVSRGEWRMPAGDYGNLRYSTLDTINDDQRDEPARGDDLLDRHSARARRAAAGVRQHDVRRHAVPEQPDRRRSDQAGRRGEMDLRAAPRSARGRHRLLRRRQPRRERTPTARSSTACSTPPSSRSTPRPARRCGGRRVGDINRGETFTAAPIVVKDHVLVGNSGGELGVRGYVAALDVKTGKELWRAFNTGPDSDVKIGPDFHAFYAKDQGKDLGVTLVAGRAVEARRLHGLGLDLVRPGDQSVLLRHRQSRASGTPDLRPGDNKWSCSIIARDADTGEARWAYQVTAHDSWDYDEIMENVLVDMDYGGRPRKLLVHPGPHRLRLRARSRNRRAAVGRNVPADELGERLRPEDRQGRTRIPPSRRTSARSRRGSVRRRPAPRTSSRRRSRRAPACSTSPRTTPAWTTRGSRRTTSPARRISAPT